MSPESAPIYTKELSRCSLSVALCLNDRSVQRRRAGYDPGLTRIARYPMEPLISIVDDDKAVRDALQRMLNAHGFTTDVFASAEQFLNRPKSRNASCLILDVNMPGMTGVALHNYLIATACVIPTILITGCPTSGERRRVIASGAASYLAKPLSEEVLIDTIRGALKNGGPAEGAVSEPGRGTSTED